MTVPDPVTLAVDAALTPSLAEAAAGVDAFLRVRSPDAPDLIERIWADRPYELTASALRVLTKHVYATGAPCDGEQCEEGGAAHCHRCAEAETDKLLRERNEARNEAGRLTGELVRAELALKELRGQIAREIETTPHACHEPDGTYCACADLQRQQDAQIARGAMG